MIFNRQHKFFWLNLSFFFVGSIALIATPIKLTVQPEGADQVELTFGPVAKDVAYEVLVRTNGPEGHWMTFAGDVAGNDQTISITANLTNVPGLTMETLPNWKFVAGCWDDTFGDELPPLYKDLVLRCDPFAPADPYGDPMHDGWNNLQKLQDNKDPLRVYVPPTPVGFEVRHYTNGSIITKWIQSGSLQGYFSIERSEISEQPNTNWVPLSLASHFDQTDARFSPPRLGTNPMFPFRPRNGTNSSFPTQLQIRTNWPPSFPIRPRFSPNPVMSPFVTVSTPFHEVARVPSQAGVYDYSWIDTNADPRRQYNYRVTAFGSPLHSVLDRVDTDGIRKTILTIAPQPTTNGYNLVAFHPIPYAYYLLLVRDKNNPQWRASGYFSSGTNQNPIYLHVDKKGMMSDGQSPIAMPEVRFLSDVVQPEFVAGWGEDSDGDGLPDIYEVLVTHTKPDNADTGETGILDGYKEMTSDGWSNLEKFRRRVNPLRSAQIPATVELKRPTGQEILKAITPTTDLHYESQIEVRTNGAANYQPIEKIPWILYQRTNMRQLNERKDFDMRVSWHFPEPKPNQYQNNRYMGP